MPRPFPAEKHYPPFDPRKNERKHYNIHNTPTAPLSVSQTPIRT